MNKNEHQESEMIPLYRKLQTRIGTSSIGTKMDQEEVVKPHSIGTILMQLSCLKIAIRRLKLLMILKMMSTLMIQFCMVLVLAKQILSQRTTPST